MSRKSNIVLTIALAAIVFIMCGLCICRSQKGIYREELGLRKETLYDESKSFPPWRTYKKEPGESKGSRDPLRIVHL